MDQDWKIQLGEEVYVYTHIRVTHVLFGDLPSHTVITWCSWHWGWRWCWFGRRCTLSFAPPACLLVLYCAIVGRQRTVRLIFTNHCQVSFPCSVHFFMPWKVNTPLHLFPDFSARCLDLLLHFLHCGTRKPSFGHFGLIQGKVHVRLF